jgi:bifunctional non-homologous end joining protein LigD
MTVSARVELTSLDRVLWKEAGFTKGAMLDYYERVAPVLLPHLADRPVTVARFPEGVDEYGWYETNCRVRPTWVRTHRIRNESYCLVDDEETLLWAANRGGIEFHPFLARRPRLDEPTAVVFDLDPGEPAGLRECAEVALRLRTLLDGDGLASYSKTSGALGLHVYVPLAEGHSFAATKAFARGVAATLAAEGPALVVDRVSRQLRAGKVLVDWAQNNPTRSLVAPYSLRAMPLPIVSMPLRWEELEDRDGLVFTPAEALARIERLGDLFEPVLRQPQRLPQS